MRKSLGRGQSSRLFLSGLLILAVCFQISSMESLAQTTGTALKSRIESRSGTRAGSLKAVFSYGPKFPIAGHEVQFIDGSAGNPKAWTWDFGDGSISSSRNPVHVYSKYGIYTVSLSVTDGADIAAATRRIPIYMMTSPKNSVSSVSALSSSFTFAPVTPAAGQAVQFTDQTSGTLSNWQWSFGDGGSSSIQNPSHTYAAPGLYSVTLTVRSGTQATSTTNVIKVEPQADPSSTISAGPPPFSAGSTIFAASPSYADVSSAISRAQSGDTVSVPEGSATWPSALVITKGIKLVGAGMGKTIITSGYTGHASYTNYTSPSSHLITYYPQTPEADEPFRLSGFSIDLNGSCFGPYLYNPTLQPITKVRIDHCELKNSYSGGMQLIMVVGTVYGCIDNNILSGGTFMFRCFGLNDVSWNGLRFDYGTADNIYFEDNVINCDDAVVEGGAGGRYAFRYNVINLSANVFGIWDAHGNGGGGGNNATMGIEVYENTVNWGSNGGRILDHRGGMALVYNNHINSTSWVGAQTREEYIDYLVPPVVNPISGQPQHVYQSYYWNNVKNGTTEVGSDIPPGLYPAGGQVDYGGAIGLVPRWNVDCWKQLAGFDGTAGIGVGLLRDRPAMGSVGVAYWATDAKTLYRWTANGNWEEFYKPYSYPHPLRSLF